MRNKFAGYCTLCKKWVERGAGHFERVRGQGTWVLKHAECVLKDREKKFGKQANVKV